MFTKSIGDACLMVVAKDCVSANILRVKVGTTGLCGGDSSHGARTYFSLEDKCSTDMRINKTEDGVEIMLGGDTEILTFIEALQFAVDYLKLMTGDEQNV